MHEDDSSSDDEKMNAPQLASADVMATRKIAGMNRKFNKTNTAAASASAAASNNKTSPVIDAQMKSLNANFLKSVNDGINKNPVADLTVISTKYIEYVKKVMGNQIEVKKLEVPKVEVKVDTIKTDDAKPNPFSMFASFGSANTTPAPVSAPTPAAVSVPKLEVAPKVEEIKTTAPITVDSDSEDDSEDEIKIQGPTFTIDKLPTTKGGFKFGVAPPKDDSDSEDEVEIKGPSFTSNVQIKDSVFKFPTKAAEKKEPLAEEKPASISFNFGAPKTESKPASNGFTFGAAKTDETKPATSGFTFGAAKTEETKPAPSFNFGTPKTEESKPASSGFTFGAPKAQETKPASSFNFGKPVESSAFSFGKTEEVKKPETNETPAAPAKSAFSFGKVETPAFSLDKPASTETKTTSAFKFGEKSTETATPAPASTPKFNFTSGSNSGNTTPAFSFSKPEASASVFSLGKTDESAKSNPFSFGGSSSTTSATTTPFTFSAPTPAAAAAPTTEQSTEGGDADANEAEQDNVKGNFAVVKLTEKIDVKSGEENEETLISKRSKVTKFNSESKSYDVVGLGDMKVLKNADTGKSRILVRSEGSGNVVLNILVLKEVKFEIMGKKNNMIRVPSVNANGGMETYLLMVKTANDASEVLSKLEEQQQ